MAAAAIMSFAVAFLHAGAEPGLNRGAFPAWGRAIDANMWWRLSPGVLHAVCSPLNNDRAGGTLARCAGFFCAPHCCFVKRPRLRQPTRRPPLKVFPSG